MTLLAVGNLFAAPARTTYQAKIIKPDGYPLEAAGVNFRFTILDPTGSCVLYSEDYAAVNMVDSGGLISISLGSGVRSFPTSGPAATFSAVFDNSITAFSCQSPGIYSPIASDNRKIVMQFQDSSGWQTLPAMSINAVPYAMYAGKSDDALKLNNKADTAFVEYATLAGLSCAADQAIKFNGVSFSCITVGSGGGGGITSVTTSGTVLTTGGTASAPVISITAASMSADGYLTSLDYAEFKAKLSTSSTQIINTLGYAPVSSSAVATQIDAAASSSAVANTLVKRDASGNFTANDIYASSTKINYVDIYKPSTNFNIRLQAPTSLSADYVLTLPTSSGTVGQVLSTDGTGNLSWINPSTGSITSVSATAPLSSTGGSTPTISITRATSTTDGYLAGSDFTTFSQKLDRTGNLSDLTNIATARTNLGLGDFATASSVDLGSASATGTLAIARLPNFIGDATIQAASNTIIFSNSGVTSDTYTKVSVNAKGLVTSGTQLTNADVTTALGYTPANSATVVSSQWVTSGTTINYMNGNVGIGTTAPTAKLHLAAGTASLAPLKFTSGTLLSSPQSGTMEYDGSEFYLTDGTNNRRAIATGSNPSAIDNASYINSTGNITMTPVGSVVVSSTTASTNSATGALIVNGGLGVAGNIYTSGTIVTSSNIQGVSVTATSGMISPYLYGSTISGGNLYIDSTTHATKGNILLAPNGGNVGIGTTAPLTSLHVKKDNSSTNFATDSNNNLVLQNTDSTANNFSSLWFHSGSAYEAAITTKFLRNPTYGSDLIFSTRDSSNNLANHMVIASNGNIGIGTVSPSARLELYASSSSGTAALLSNSELAPTSSNAIDLWGINHTTKYNSAYAGNRVIGAHIVASNISTGNLSAMIGTVGVADNISTASVSSIVGVYGRSKNYSTGLISDAKGMYTFVHNIGGGTITNGYGLYVDSVQATNKWSIYSSDSTAPSYFAGNVGIGTTAPQELLEINKSSNPVLLLHDSSTSSFKIGIDEADSGVFKIAAMENGFGGHVGSFTANDSQVLTMNTVGHVGIGTTDPTVGVSFSSSNRLLTIEANGTSNPTLSGGLVLANGGSLANNHELGHINFAARQNGAGTDNILARITSRANGSGGPDGFGGTLQFFTKPDNIDGGSLERMRIASNGHVGIGTTGPSAKLHIVDESTATPRNLVIDNYSGGGNAAQIWGRAARGNSAAPAAVQAGDPLLNLIGSAYDGTSFNEAGHIRVLAESNQSSSVHNSFIEFTTASGTTLSEQMRITSNGNVGIGTTSPVYPLHIERNNNFSMLLKNTGTGDQCTGIFTDNTSDPSYASWIHTCIQSGIPRLKLGVANKSYGWVSNPLEIDLRAPTSSLYMNNLGNVGIGGTTIPSEKLHVVGNLRVQGSTDCTLGNGAGGTNCSSDARLKENIKPIPYALEKINSLKGVEFDWNSKSLSFGRHDIGVIAQDVEKVFPSAVIDDKSTGYKKVDYAVLVAPLIQAVKELYNLINADKAEIEVLKRKVAEVDVLKVKSEKLEAENKAMKARLEKIEKALNSK